LALALPGLAVACAVQPSSTAPVPAPHPVALAEASPESLSSPGPPRSPREWLQDPHDGVIADGEITFAALGLAFVPPSVLHQLRRCGEPEHEMDEGRVPLIVCGSTGGESVRWVLWLEPRRAVPRFDAMAAETYGDWIPFEEVLSASFATEYLGSSLEGVEIVSIDARQDPERAFRRFYWDVDSDVVGIIELVSLVPADDPASALDWVQLVRAIRRVATP
jgi:hypothetical protein